MGFGISLAGIQASWLPEPRKCELSREFEATLAALDAAIDPADRELEQIQVDFTHSLHA